jgi:hypothetical protein
VAATGRRGTEENRPTVGPPSRGGPGREECRESGCAPRDAPRVPRVRSTRPGLREYAPPGALLPVTRKGFQDQDSESAPEPRRGGHNRAPGGAYSRNPGAHGPGRFGCRSARGTSGRSAGILPASLMSRKKRLRELRTGQRRGRRLPVPGAKGRQPRRWRRLRGGEKRCSGGCERVYSNPTVESLPARQHPRKALLLEVPSDELAAVAGLQRSHSEPPQQF